MSMKIINVISIEGHKGISCSQKYPVSNETTIELKGEFRSSGKIKSIIYFGLDCFDEKGERINAWQVHRVNEPLILTSINSDGKSFTLNKKPEKWNNSDENNIKENRERKYLGFYFDGNIKRLPDYIINSPAYKVYTDNNIYLNNEIPKEILSKIIPFKTIVMNQYNSANYDYSAAFGSEVPEQWKLYEARYNGFSEGGEDIKGKFRPETKSVSPIMWCNYQQNKEDAILEIRNIEIKVTDKPKFN